MVTAGDLAVLNTGGTMKISDRVEVRRESCETYGLRVYRDGQVFGPSSLLSAPEAASIIYITPYGER